MRARHKIKQKSISYFPSRKTERPYPSLYTHMFEEDIRNMVVPYGFRDRESPGFQIELAGPEHEIEKCLSIFGSFSRYERGDIDESICDAIREITTYLLLDGISYYEIVNDSSMEELVTLERFPSSGTLRLPFGYLQIVPRRDFDRVDRRFAYIKSKRVWTIEIPPELSGVRGYRKLVKSMERFDSHGPKFWQTDLENKIIGGEFKLSDYVAYFKTYLFRATKFWGWNARDLAEDYSTEYFTIYRMIKFKSALAELREHIVVELNNLLSMLELESRIAVRGLLASGELRTVLRKFSDGEILFNEIFDKTKA
jgi:hypothetical protein